MQNSRQKVLSLLTAPILAAVLAAPTPARAGLTGATAERPLGILFQTAPRPFKPSAGIPGPRPPRFRPHR